MTLLFDMSEYNANNITKTIASDTCTKYIAKIMTHRIGINLDLGMLLTLVNRKAEMNRMYDTVAGVKNRNGCRKLCVPFNVILDVSRRRASSVLSPPNIFRLIKEINERLLKNT
jgi:hypothetical protein